jgi:ubiquinone biosynthesis protein UbiJ
MSNATSVQDSNRELADRINEEARRNPQSPYLGKFVGIANGRVVVVADTLDDLAQRLPQFEADPSKTFCIEAGIDYDAIQEIWGLP